LRPVRLGGAFVAIGICGVYLLTAGRPAHAQSPPPPAAPAEISDARPYDDKLIRLSVVIGAVHYLRELCGGNDGALWRDRMRELIETDKGSALRRVKLTKSFNHGYRSYRRTYTTCTGPAQATLTKFIAEGAELSDLLLRETQ
jgi:uncharacterized protein (TIGR02301 family)